MEPHDTLRIFQIRASFVLFFLGFFLIIHLRLGIVAAVIGIHVNVAPCRLSRSIGIFLIRMINDRRTASRSLVFLYFLFFSLYLFLIFGRIINIIKEFFLSRSPESQKKHQRQRCPFHCSHDYFSFFNYFLRRHSRQKV